ncbi:MAG: hypothetical protein ACT6U0_29160 [Shinella sp.]
MVVDIKRNERRAFGDAGIARRRIERGEEGRLRQLPVKGVLASARSDQKNLHTRTLDPSLIAGGLSGRGLKVKGWKAPWLSLAGDWL